MSKQCGKISLKENQELTLTRVNKDDFPAKVAAELKDFDPKLYG